MRDNEREELEYEVFEAKQRALIAESKVKGLQKNLRDRKSQRVNWPGAPPRGAL